MYATKYDDPGTLQNQDVQQRHFICKKKIKKNDTKYISIPMETELFRHAYYLHAYFLQK